jgi:hypothetical protein
MLRAFCLLACGAPGGARWFRAAGTEAPVGQFPTLSYCCHGLVVDQQEIGLVGAAQKPPFFFCSTCTTYSAPVLAKCWSSQIGPWSVPGKSWNMFGGWQTFTTHKSNVSRYAQVVLLFLFTFIKRWSELIKHFRLKMLILFFIRPPKL